MRKRTRILAACAGAGLLVFGCWWAGWEMTTPPARKALPWSAREVRDEGSEDFPSDYTYYLKARIAAEGFAPYCRKLGLSPHSQGRKYAADATWLSWMPLTLSGKDIPWWDPSGSLEGTWVQQEGHSWTLAKFERGFVYLKSLSH